MRREERAANRRLHRRRDGSGYIEDKGMQTCPGAVPGQYGANVRTTTNPGLALVDTQGVDISGLEIRNFCIGVLGPVLN
jgi:3-dehydroshikimate dehydratase